MPAMRLAPGQPTPSVADFAGAGMMTLPGVASGAAKGLSAASRAIKALIAEKRMAPAVPTGWADEGEGMGRWLADEMKRRATGSAFGSQKALPAAGQTYGAPDVFRRQALIEQMTKGGM
jgi:hypothetical protein